MSVEDIRIKLDFYDHPKTVKLKRKLGINAVVSLQQLWIYAAQNRSKGILHGLDDEDIAIASRWDGDADKFINGLIDVKFLEKGEDGTLILHDWEEHQPFAFYSEERSKQARAAAAARWGGEKSNSPNSPNIMSPACGEDADSMLTACGEHTGSIQSAMLNHSISNAPIPTPTPKPNPSPTPDINNTSGDKKTHPGSKNSSPPPAASLNPEVQKNSKKWWDGEIEDIQKKIFGSVCLTYPQIGLLINEFQNDNGKFAHPGFGDHGTLWQAICECGKKPDNPFTWLRTIAGDQRRVEELRKRSQQKADSNPFKPMRIIIPGMETNEQ